MSRKSSLPLLFAVMCAVFSVLVFPDFVLGAAIESKSKINFDFQIPLPGLEYSGNSKLTGIEISQYIKALYIWGVRAATILAAAVLAYGGMLWITSRGDKSKIGESQKVMGNALIGLLLALGSYTFLYTINPQLVTEKKITPHGIYNVELELKEDPDASPLSTVPTTLPIGLPHVPGGNRCCGYIETINDIYNKDEGKTIEQRTIYTSRFRTSSINKDDCMSIIQLPKKTAITAFFLQWHPPIKEDEKTKLVQANILKRVLFCPPPTSCPSIDGTTGKIGNGEYDDPSIDTCIPSSP